MNKIKNKKINKIKPAYLIYKELLEIDTANSKTYLWEAERLAKLQELNWQGIADHIENINDFAKEYGKSVGHIKQLIKVFEVFGKHITSDKVPAFRRLYKALPVITDEKSAKKWLDKSLNLISRDFNDEIRIAQGKPSQNDCEHKLIETKIIKRCKVCKKVLGYEIKKG